MQFLMEITNLLFFLVKISTLRMKIVKYECILPRNSRYFDNFISNNCSNESHKCVFFLWDLILYKILCDIIYTLSCRGERNGFVTPYTFFKINFHYQCIFFSFLSKIKYLPSQSNATLIHPFDIFFVDIISFDILSFDVFDTYLFKLYINKDKHMKILC
jgi:hypothetical protein